jgi:phage-related protein
MNLEVKMKLKTVLAGDWQVLAVCTERGDCPLLDFLAGLEGRLARDGWRMLKLLDRVAAQGPPRNTEISHQLASGIWEFIQGRLRVLWFYDDGKLVICSHGFLKKRQKTPAGEIERARENQRLYAEAKACGNVEIEG